MRGKKSLILIRSKASFLKIIIVTVVASGFKLSRRMPDLIEVERALFRGTHQTDERCATVIEGTVELECIDSQSNQNALSIPESIELPVPISMRRDVPMYHQIRGDWLVLLPQF